MSSGSRNVKPVAASIDYSRVALISLGHGTNDLSGNLFTSLMPYLIIRGTITASLGGLILLLYLMGSSVLQPIFGLMSDRSGRRLYAAAGPLWVALCVAPVGWVGGGVELFILAMVGGIGTAAFHPQAASMVGNLSPRKKGWAMSIFSVGGNLGFAIGPLVAATIAVIGMRWTVAPLALAIPVTILLFLYAPDPTASAEPFDAVAVKREVLASLVPLGLLVAVIATRSAVQFGLIVFLPLFYHAHGMSAQLGSIYATVLSLAGAVGGLAGGHLSDIYGRKVVVVSTLVATTPLVILILITFNPLIWPLLSIAGACLLASNSVTVVQAQELLPSSTGIASGLALGLGFGLSGVIAAGLTLLSDHIGVNTTIFMVPFLALLAAVLAILVPARPRTEDPANVFTDLSTGAAAGGQ